MREMRPFVNARPSLIILCCCTRWCVCARVCGVDASVGFPGGEPWPALTPGARFRYRGPWRIFRPRPRPPFQKARLPREEEGERHLGGITPPTAAAAQGGDPRMLLARFFSAPHVVVVDYTAVVLSCQGKRGLYFILQID